MEELIKIIDDTNQFFDELKDITFTNYRSHYSKIYDMIWDVSRVINYYKQHTNSLTNIDEAKEKVKASRRIIESYAKSIGIKVPNKVEETIMKLDTGEIDLTDVINQLNDASIGELPENIGIYTNFEKGTRL